MKVTPKLFEVEDTNTAYSKKIQIPQYVPSEFCPNIESLIDIKKYSKLIFEINSSSVNEEEKRFLKLAAARHLVFNYAEIADYYAHADKEMQELMEKSALVLLDMNDAIANGYVNLSKKMEELIASTAKHKEVAKHD